MIDWITVLINYPHKVPLKGGDVISITPDGEIEWTSTRKMSVRGSYESNLLIRSQDRIHDGSYSKILIDGNFVKFHQGHNLFGSDDLRGLVSETFLKLAKMLALTINDACLNSIHKGTYDLLRVDCTMMTDLGNLANVESFLYNAEYSAHMRYRGQGVMTKGTLYFGKTSRRWALKMYAKGREIQADGHSLPSKIESPSLVSWVDGKLRLELVLRSLELKKRGLSYGFCWEDFTSFDNLTQSLEGLTLSGSYKITSNVLSNLKPRLVAIYELWKQGYDLKTMYSKNTFYSYRRQLIKELQIDIAIKQSKDDKKRNRVSFDSALKPKLSEQVPEWAIGTNLYFEPRANFNLN
jgi:II/X family phage/plasmid replication protein